MRVILFLLKCLVGIFASVGFLLLAGLVVLVIAIPKVEELPWQVGVEEVPEETVLILDLAGGIVETRPDNPLARASLGKQLVLREALEALEAASDDPKVKGLVARLGRGSIGMAEVQELRDAIGDFRASGRFAVAFSESFGEGGNGTLHFYLATAFEEIWLQPSGNLDVTGFALESPFLREALDTLGIEPRLGQREEYKGAMNTFTDQALPEPQRQNLQRLVDSWVSQITRAVAKTRGMEVENARGLIDKAPYLATEALDLGLVDTLGYWDQVEAGALGRAGEAAEFLNVMDYQDLKESAEPEGPVIALIYGLGPVVLDSSENDPLFGQVAMGSDTISQALSEAMEDDQVKAVIFRIDSPGGSYVASDVIWRDMQRARDAGLPVIVSMSNLAASGGYFVAAPAAKIVAQPGTVTGSIGVVSGKLVLAGLWDKLGINWDGVQAGANADIWSMNRDFTPAGWQRLQETLDQVYEDFTRKVADGRGLDMAKTLAAAKGQVWSGEDALAMGLVDELGGFRRALVLAREAAGIEPEATVNLKRFPEADSPFASFLEEILGLGVEGPLLGPVARGLARIMAAFQPMIEAYQLVTADPRARQLMAPELRPAP